MKAKFLLTIKMDREKTLGEEEFTSWGDVMCLDREKVKDILIVRPFHNIYDFCGFAMTDLLKVQKFHLEIELTDEIL